jgi:hypothetical protein
MIPAYPFWSLSVFTLDILDHPGPHRHRQADLQRRMSARYRPRHCLGETTMFFRSRRHEPAGEKLRLADIGDAGTDEATLRRSQQLIEWRRPAQRVTGAWNAWLAAGTRDRGRRYYAFVVTVAGEESPAAGLERMIDSAEAGHGVDTVDAKESGLGARWG